MLSERKGTAMCDEYRAGMMRDRKTSDDNCYLLSIPRAQIEKLRALPRLTAAAFQKWIIFRSFIAPRRAHFPADKNTRSCATGGYPHSIPPHSQLFSSCWSVLSLSFFRNIFSQKSEREKRKKTEQSMDVTDAAALLPRLICTPSQNLNINAKNHS